MLTFEKYRVIRITHYLYNIYYNTNVIMNTALSYNDGGTYSRDIPVNLIFTYVYTIIHKTLLK